MQAVHKLYDCELKDFSEKERAFTAVASTESKDRDGDILRANGWKLKNYRKNPVVLWGHDAFALPIAKAKEINITEGKMIFRPQFATAEENPFAEQVFRMFKGGFLRAFSVRFDPIEWKEIEPEQNPEDTGKSDTTTVVRRGIEYKSMELLEISAVNIPANAEALKSPDMLDLVQKSYVISYAKLFPGFIVQKTTYQCECIDCGHKMESESHCKDLKCPECGGQMRRAERPGPGQADYDFSSELKEKYGRLDELQRAKELRRVESEIDEQIKGLELEIENDKAINELQKKIKELHAGITGLVKK